MEIYDPKLKQLSKQLRNSSTDTETLIWAKIRMRQLKGFLFYRQKPLGGYIADFYCPKAKLIIEVDGGQHRTPDSIKYDEVRDMYMKNIGLKTLRFTNIDVLENIDGVVKIIENNLK